MELPALLITGFIIWVGYKLLSKPKQISENTVEDVPKIEQLPDVFLEQPPKNNESNVVDETNVYDEEQKRDKWEGSFWDVVQPIPAKATLRLKYTDGDGQQSERTVDVRQFGVYGESTLLIGHCRMRNATRSFRVDRVQSCVDGITGEIIDDIPTFLRRIYDESPDRTKDLLVEGEFDTLRILLYVGKADGQLRAAEKTVIRDTCIAITNDSRITEAMIGDLLWTMDVPTIQAFKMAVGRIAKRGQDARDIVLIAAGKIVATQKTVHANEVEALEYIKKRFSTAL